MTALLASRVMRARWETDCPVCRCPIRIGQQIAKLGCWQHIEHVIEKQRQATHVAEFTEGDRS